MRQHTNKAERGVQVQNQGAAAADAEGRFLDRAPLRRHRTWACHHPQARTHDGRRRERGERAAQGPAEGGALPDPPGDQLEWAGCGPSETSPVLGITGIKMRANVGMPMTSNVRCSVANPIPKTYHKPWPFTSIQLPSSGLFRGPCRPCSIPHKRTAAVLDALSRAQRRASCRRVVRLVLSWPHMRPARRCRFELHKIKKNRAHTLLKV
jgi:hypothetical protein